MEWVIGANGKRAVVGVDFSDFKNTSRRTPIAFFFMKTIFILPIEAGTPREPAATIKNRPWFSNGLPSAAAFFVTLKGALSGIPSGCDADDELLRSVTGGSKEDEDDSNSMDATHSSKHGRRSMPSFNVKGGPHGCDFFMRAGDAQQIRF